MNFNKFQLNNPFSISKSIKPLDFSQIDHTFKNSLFDQDPKVSHTFQPNLNNMMVDPATGSLISALQYQSAFLSNGAYLNFQPNLKEIQNQADPYIGLAVDNDFYSDQYDNSEGNSIEDASEADEDDIKEISFPKSYSEIQENNDTNLFPLKGNDIISKTEIAQQLNLNNDDLTSKAVKENNPFTMKNSFPVHSESEQVSIQKLDCHNKQAQFKKDSNMLIDPKLLNSSNIGNQSSHKFQCEQVQEKAHEKEQQKLLKEHINQEIYIDLMIKVCDPYQAGFSINISPMKTVNELKLVITEKLIQKGLQNNTFSSNSFILMINHIVIGNSSKLSDLNITSGNTLHVIHKETILNSDLDLTFSINSNFQYQSAPIELRPLLTKKGYMTSPNITELSKMSIMDLYVVKDFEIFNEHGKIHYKNPCNLIKANLDDLFFFEPGKIDLKKSGLFEHSDFYKEATIHVYNIKAHTQPNSVLSCKEISSEGILTLDYQQKYCKEHLGIFKEYISEIEEFIYTSNIISNFIIN